MVPFPSLRRPAAACVLLIVCGAGPAPAQEAQRWIHDELRVDMRTGPSFQNRIIEFLPSGTPLTVLEENDDGWIRVRARGEEGWIQGQYTTGTPIAADRLALAERQLEEVRAERDRLSATLRELRGEAGELGTAYEEASAEVARLNAELERIRRTSAEALETAAALAALQDEATAMRARMEDLSDENVRLAGDNRAAGIKWGAAAVLAGALLAWIAASVGGRRKRSDWV